MEGRAQNFRKVLQDFESRLSTADFVAIDTELTGVDLEGEIDSFDDSAMSRLDRHCRIAERYTLIQLGLTLVSQERNGRDEIFSFASYNLFAFPYAGPDLIGRDQGFVCQASALQFNARNKVDFNTWIRDGIPYMSREDERRYKKYYGSKGSGLDDKVGLLRLWKALCSRQLPFVVHCPLDLFFLLAAFERRPLPRNDPRAMAQIIRQCTPKVVDTAHLHGALGGFKRLGLTKFAEDAKARYEELSGGKSGGNVPHLKFRLVGETASRYGSQNDGNALAHEAGFDSLVTAQLFAYLRAISPTQVREGANRLFLYKSIEYLDLERAALEGEVGACMFDLSRVTLLVAALDAADGNDAPRLITSAGYLCKWIDAQHILVVMRASGGAAVRKAADLAGKVHGVVSWMGFDEWREGEAAKVALKGQTTDTASAYAHSESPAPEAKDTPLAGETSGDWWQKLYGWGQRQPKLLAGAGFMFVFLWALARDDSVLSRLLRRVCRRPLARLAG
mmetsp:Transcript_14101/g.26359  ORF Transcript_14101/g.26359 Transcript_14101/m.26359 type:complete len:505 (-) Transcript_14101:57-1571(-)